jgi:uncharacterized protein YneF (UPF0154 family)
MALFIIAFLTFVIGLIIGFYIGVYTLFHYSIRKKPHDEIDLTTPPRCEK